MRITAFSYVSGLMKIKVVMCLDTKVSGVGCDGEGNVSRQEIEIRASM